MDGREGAPPARPWPDRSRRIHQVLVVFGLRDEPLVAVHRFFRTATTIAPSCPAFAAIHRIGCAPKKKAGYRSPPNGNYHGDLNGPP